MTNRFSLICIIHMCESYFSKNKDKSKPDLNLRNSRSRKLKLSKIINLFIFSRIKILINFYL